MADPKAKQNPPVIDPSLDREQGLALQFEDPGMDELLPTDFSGEHGTSSPSLTEDVADAVQELVLDLSSDTASEEAQFASIETNPAIHTGLPETDRTGAFEVHEMLMIEGTGLESAMHVARGEVADRMFELMVVEKSFNDLLETILAALMQAASASAGSVLELDHEQNEFFFRASIGGGDPERLRSFRVPRAQGIVGHVAESLQPLLLNDVKNDERQLRAISLSTGFEIHTCLAFPLVVANRLFAVVELFNKMGGAQFEKTDLQLMEDGSRMAGKVLEVRFLMAELARRMR